MSPLDQFGPMQRHPHEFVEEHEDSRLSRRDMMSRALRISGVGAAATVLTALGVSAASAERSRPMSLNTQSHAARNERPTPDEALAMLVEGNDRYLDPDVAPEDYSATRIGDTTHEPIAAILGCGDARVSAELIFDHGPGDLFMARVAGNVLSDYGLASLEYAVEFLDVPLLMVLGHTHCGAVTGAVQVVQEGVELPGRLLVLTDAIEPAVRQAQMQHPEGEGEELLNIAIEENVRRQAQRLQTISPVINAALEADRVMIVGAIYDIESGRVRLVA